MKPSLIRIDSDEATYNLHIILRFELEQEMITGRLAAADVPEAWDAKMMEYLGVEVPDVADGALQDTHWASGSIGYFSTYALGNVASAQLWERISEDLPDVYEQIGRGEFAPLREWLREHVHQHGRKYMPQELLERVTGSGLDPQPLLAYLRSEAGRDLRARIRRLSAWLRARNGLSGSRISPTSTAEGRTSCPRCSSARSRRSTTGSPTSSSAAAT